MKKVLHSSKAAFDLASVMVGVVVVGVLMGVVAASVWIVIPWAQDNAAKESLYTVSKAQETRYGTNKSFASFKELVDEGFMQPHSNICTTPTGEGDDFESAILSDSGKVYKNNSDNLTPVQVAVGGVSCFGVLGNNGTFTPAPRPTLLTLNCPVATTVTLPFRDVTGKVTWSDGTVNNVTPTSTVNGSNIPTKSLAANTNYTVSIEGTYTSMTSVNTASQACIRKLDQWNLASGVTSLSSAFAYSNVTSVPEPPYTVTNMSVMFANSTFNQDISNWDTSKVTNMSQMFNSNTAFNQDISSWDTSSVTNMSSMFSGATSFNKPLDNWNVGLVRNMNAMFLNASNFNQSLSSWNVSQVTDFISMFSGATRFNQPLNAWTVASGTKFSSMFQNAVYFNQPLSNWNMSSATTLSKMFLGASRFNRALYTWDVKKVTDFSGMFQGASAYNQPLYNSTYKWEINATTVKMDSMFQDAVLFNQPVNDLNVSNVTSMYAIFAGATAFNQPLDKWNVSKVINMGWMFYNADSFNQPLNTWTPIAATVMDSMFQQADIFNQNISGWNVTTVTTWANFSATSALTAANTPSKFL